MLPIAVEKEPVVVLVVIVLAIDATVGSVVELVVEGVMAVVTMDEPLWTPTTLTLEVSVMERRAQRLLMKLVTELALLKN